MYGFRGATKTLSLSFLGRVVCAVVGFVSVANDFEYINSLPLNLFLLVDWVIEMMEMKQPKSEEICHQRNESAVISRDNHTSTNPPKLKKKILLRKRKDYTLVFTCVYIYFFLFYVM